MLKRCLGATIAGTALLVVGPGAFATASATTVLSDKVTFSAQLVRNGSHTFNIQSITCSLTSDGETTPIPCQISGTLMRGNPSSVSTTITSADGTTTSGATLSFTSTGSFVGKGSGTEQDAPDPAGGIPQDYPCIAKYVGTISSSGVMSGTVKVKESGTAP
jgi:hypothetical protein